MYAEQIGKGWHFCPPGGEDRNCVCQRGRAALEKAAKQWPGASIMVVTHEGLIKSLIYHCLSRRFLSAEPSILRPYHLHVMSLGEKGLRVKKLNAMALG